MIKRLLPSTYESSWDFVNEAGSGTELSPYYWNGMDTVNGANSSITVGDPSSYEPQTVWAKFKLTESTLYTWSHDQMPDGVTFYLYDSTSTLVATGTVDGEFNWSMSYTPVATGNFTLKMDFYAMESQMTATITPVPSEMSGVLARRTYGLENGGLDRNGRYLTRRSLSAAGLSDAMASSSNAWLLMHFEGDLSDSSPTGRTNITNSGSTYEDGFFGQCIYVYACDIVIPYTNNPFGGDFTVQTWIKKLDAARLSIYSDLTDGHFRLEINNNKWCVWAGTGTWNILRGDSTDDSTTGNGGVGPNVTLNVWNHVAFVHQDNKWMLFVNGVLELFRIREGTIPDSTTQTQIGVWDNDSWRGKFLIDEFRVDTSALWTVDFTPPDRPYGVSTFL